MKSNNVPHPISSCHLYQRHHVLPYCHTHFCYYHSQTTLPLAKQQKHKNCSKGKSKPPRNVILYLEIQQILERERWDFTERKAGSDVGIDLPNVSCHRWQQYRQSPSEKGHRDSSTALLQAQGRFLLLMSRVMLLSLLFGCPERQRKL